ncbi:CheR family methyltransferase [Bacillus badius]|uniref:Chemotaxis protein methyltransferase CheR n=1 Tax=Bacillus badius TaxID=1455 RepID=A0ABR5AT10_BACBA|nr:Chemotaxis protein methyltransferase CheR [Bacillus badius]KZN98616.1 chemotaxis protein CheR [Bacillus badius]KZR59301.1 chemotaxis protein CheR [Bacillus badius]OCS83555.1 chemotaxis protein CheR [Bacillus badius]OVE53160.1 chemotaxis protein CheR [Bacillus badius]
MQVSKALGQDEQNQCLPHKELETVELTLLLEGIYRYYGVDFRNYALPFIKRRIWNRMQAEQVKTISGLQELVLRCPAIMDRLFEDFSINVTEMFRDPSFFLAFRTKVVPFLRNCPSIKIWHAGCSTGEEVYSMAILLHEEGLYERTTIYATDMNTNVLGYAQNGEFPLRKMQLYTKNYLAAGGARAFSEYYTARQKKAAFHSFLARNIVFSKHNLAVDRSFNEFHVIICRNVMIYFNKLLQNRVHHLFHESLVQSGILGIGSKEGIKFMSITNFYEEVDPFERLYRKIQ